jgi:hypothetical protein
MSGASEPFIRWLTTRNVPKGAGFVFRERWNPRFDNILPPEHIDRIDVPSLNELPEMGRFETQKTVLSLNNSPPHIPTKEIHFCNMTLPEPASLALILITSLCDLIWHYFLPRMQIA